MSNPSSTVHTAAELESSWLNDPLNYMVKAFIAFLQTIWETAPAGCFHWSPDIEHTELVIAEANTINQEVIDKRPSISVLLGPAKFNGTALDDLVSIDATNAQEVHTDLLPGTMTLNCLSRVPTEARYIAWMCARTIWNLRKLFIHESCIHEVGRNITVGAVSPAGALVQGDTEGEWHSVAVSCPFFLQWTDTVLPLTKDWNGRPIHRLNEITVRLQTRLAQSNLTHSQDAGAMFWGQQASATRDSELARRQAALRPPSIRGRTIQTPTSPGSNSSPLVSEHKV